MTLDVEEFEKHVNLDSYSFSPGYIGFYERSCAFDECLCAKAIEVFKHAFADELDQMMLVSSLYVESDFERIVDAYHVSSKDLNDYIEFLVNAGFLRVLDYELLHRSVHNEEEYFAHIDQFERHLKAYYPVDEVVRDKAFYAVMAVDGIKGHCFAVLQNRELIAYPHDDTGFGFIAYGSQSKEATSAFVRDKFDCLPFRVCINKEL